MTDLTDPLRQAAVDAGEKLLLLARRHVDQIASGDDDSADETDSALWEAVAQYGDALDDLYDGADDAEIVEPDELTFTVRARYDYTVIDEKAFLSAGTGVAGAIAGLLQRAGGKPIPALEVASLETGSGLITVHLNGEPLSASDFADADEPTDLLLIDPGETLQFVLDEPIYGSRSEAEAAAARDASD